MHKAFSFILGAALLIGCSTDSSDNPPVRSIPVDTPVAQTPSNIAVIDAPAAAILTALRAEAGRGPLTADDRLEAAAVVHAKDLAASGTFSHRGTDGSTPGQRARRQGFDFCLVAENIARGQDSLVEVFDSWMNSSGHRQNILNGTHTRFGLARSEPDDTWVLMLGKPGC